MLAKALEVNARTVDTGCSEHERFNLGIEIRISALD